MRAQACVEDVEASCVWRRGPMWATTVVGDGYADGRRRVLLKCSCFCCCGSATTTFLGHPPADGDRRNWVAKQCGERGGAIA